MKLSTSALATTVCLFCLSLAARPSAARGPANDIQQSELILQPAGDTVEHDTFGTAVAIDGDTMIIGAVNADGNQEGAGAAFIFERSGDAWVQTARLFAADGKAEPLPLFPGKFRSDSFGTTVAISGDTVIVGAPAHAHAGQAANSGAVYVFVRVNGAWTQQAELLSPTPNNQDEFGAGQGFGGIAISGDIAVVTDQGRAITLPGAVDVFTRANGAWTLATQLTVPADFFFLPSALAFDGRTLVAGSSLSDAPSAFEAGVAYLFRFDGGTWSAPVTLAAADATSGAQFGASVSLGGNLIAVGANTAPGATAQSGAAYVFAREGAVWTQAAELAADDGADGDDFGVSIATDGATVIVGATSHTPPLTAAAGVGAAFVFGPQHGSWQELVELAASDGFSGGDYGVGVAVLGHTLLVGADLQHPEVEGYPGGEAYVYRLAR
jgi:hypothetical protein